MKDTKKSRKTQRKVAHLRGALRSRTTSGDEIHMQRYMQGRRCLTTRIPRETRPPEFPLPPIRFPLPRIAPELTVAEDDSWGAFDGLSQKRLLEKEAWRDFAEHVGLITTLYWALSGYGVRAARAFWVLVGISAAFAVLCMLLGPDALQVSSASNFGQAMEHRGRAVVYSLSTIAQLNPEPKPDPGLFQFLVTIEGILGPL